MRRSQDEWRASGEGNRCERTGSDVGRRERMPKRSRSAPSITICFRLRRRRTCVRSTSLSFTGKPVLHPVLGARAEFHYAKILTGRRERPPRHRSAAACPGTRTGASYGDRAFPNRWCSPLRPRASVMAAYATIRPDCSAGYRTTGSNGRIRFLREQSRACNGCESHPRIGLLHALHTLP